MLLKPYNTIREEASVEITIRKSVFIASAKPVETEDDALEFLNAMRKKYSDATHHCYAYFTTGSEFVQRFSDDGEPGGTAGVPILEVMRREGLQNIIIVVTRYFGGIQLGVGGLVRAYSKAASAVIATAGTVLMEPCIELMIETEYTVLGKLQNALKAYRCEIAGVEYKENILVKVIVPTEGKEQDMIVSKINDISGGSATITYGREFSYCLKV